MRLSHRRLALESLESREVPAGTITASLIGGVLTMNGDDFGNEVTLHVTATQVTLTPDATTTIDSLGDPASPVPGDPVTLTGRTAAVTAFLRDGDDSVRINPSADFIVPGVVLFDLGDGDNTLELEQNPATEELLSIGTLLVRAGDGFDTVAIHGGIRGTFEDPGGPQFSHIQAINMQLGDGGSDTTLGEGFLGRLPNGVTIIAGDGRDEVHFRQASLGNLAIAGGPGLLRVDGMGGGLALNLSAAEVEFDWLGGSFGGFPTAAFPVTITGSSRAAVTVHEAGVFAPMTVQALRRDGVATVDVVGPGLQLLPSPPTASLTVRSAGSASLIVRPGSEFFINGRVSVAAGHGDAEFRLDGGRAVVNGPMSVSSTGGNARIVQTGSSQLGLHRFEHPDFGPFGPLPNLAVTAFKDAELNLAGGTAEFGGSLTVSGQTAGRLTQTGATATVTGSLRVAGGAAEAVLDVGGGSWIAKGTTTVTSPGRAVLDLTPTTTGRLEGNVLVQGGSGFDEISASAPTEFMKNLTVSLGAGGGRVDLAPGTTVGGSLTVTGGTGADEVSLRGVDVTGATRIVTGGGTDTLTVDLGATFDATFFADLGGGADTINIAQGLGTPGPVTFTGKATILGGTGGDILRLGQTGADPNRRAVFGTAGSVIDGGAGVNLFDDEQAVFSGPVSIVHWTDPTP